LAETLTTRVVFLDRASLKAKLRPFAFPAEYIEHPKTDAAEIVTRLRGATIAIVNKVPMRADTLRQLPQLKMIAVAATGYDVVDISYCNERKMSKRAYGTNRTSFASSRTTSVIYTVQPSGSSARARSARARQPSGALSACACCSPIIRRRRCRMCSSHR
jgi:phosphoglycerate dehydrogenase-like enzyme